MKGDSANPGSDFKWRAGCRRSIVRRWNDERQSAGGRGLHSSASAVVIISFSAASKPSIVACVIG